MTLANSEESDEMLLAAAFHLTLHYLLLKTKTIFEKEIQFYLEIIICDPSNYTMDHPKFIVSNQKKESISAKRAMPNDILCHMTMVIFL